MEISTGIEVRQTQRLGLSLSMRQSIAILGMTSDELRSHIDEIALENPLVELLEDRSAVPANTTYRQDREPNDFTSDLISRPESLWSSLLRQIELRRIPEAIQPVVLFMLEQLNERGLLEASLEGVADACRCPVSDATKALAIIQSLEPTGVGARDVHECIVLQLEASGIAADLHRRILCELGRGNTDAENLSRVLESDPDVVLRCLAEIKATSFDVTGSFEESPESFVVPDLLFQVSGTNSVEVSLNPAAFPKLSRNDSYFSTLPCRNADVIRFRKSCRRQYDDLLTACERRAATLLRIGKYIAATQSGYFIDGPLRHKPMRMVDVATELGLNVSTVSRAVSRKYCHDGRDLLELKELFATGVSSGVNGTISSLAICSEIQSIIDNETRGKVLSDVQIANLLKFRNIDISRRTVSKYRQKLNVLPLALRRIRLSSECG